MGSVTKHILIVEDDRSVRESLQAVLRLEGFECFAAENGEKALEVLARTRPVLVLLDLMMPVMDGWEFLSLLRRMPLYRDIPVIVISAAGDEAASDLSASAYVRKPIDVDELLRVMRSLC